MKISKSRKFSVIDLIFIDYQYIAKLRKGKKSLIVHIKQQNGKSSFNQQTNELQLSKELINQIYKAHCQRLIIEALNVKPLTANS